MQTEKQKWGRPGNDGSITVCVLTNFMLWTPFPLLYHTTITTKGKKKQSCRRVNDTLED